MIGIFRKVFAALRYRYTGEKLSNRQTKLIDNHVRYRKRLSAAGRKMSRKSFTGSLGLRGRILTGASLLAQQGKLGTGWMSVKSVKERTDTQLIV